MTELLYYKDQYVKDFTATVVEVNKKGNFYESKKNRNISFLHKFDNGNDCKRLFDTFFDIFFR